MAGLATYKHSMEYSALARPKYVCFAGYGNRSFVSGVMNFEDNVLFSFQFLSENGASSHPCSDNYHGSSAMSESEVQHVARFLESQGKRLVGYLDIHSYSQIWMFPWGYTKKRSRDYDELVQRIADSKLRKQVC